MCLTYASWVPLVTTKKKCCRSSKRCSKCPVVLMRLEKEGFAECCERHSGAKATYKVKKSTPKKAIKAARKR